MNREPLIVFDTDGVLAIYERDAYHGETPKAAIPYYHYFRSVKPNPLGIALLQALLNQNENIRVVTNLATETPFSTLKLKHACDKMLWFKRYLPFLYEKGRTHICDNMTKADFIRKLYGLPTLNLYDILISDFNNDLLSWNAAGGTGVKYLNGINSPESYPGLSVSQFDPIDQQCRLIKSIRE